MVFLRNICSFDIWQNAAYLETITLRKIRAGFTYNRATQTADRLPNPDLWMVKSGPRQPLTVVFYRKVSYQI